MKLIALNIDWQRLCRVRLTHAVVGLPRDRAARIVRFIREVDKYRSALAGHLAPRLFQALRPGAPVPAVGTSTMGRPYFIGKGHPDFNLAHSGHWVVGIASDGPVGIDVEEIRPNRGILADVLSVEERLELGALAASDQTERFTRLWALKEAHSKAIGTGLQSVFRDLSFQLSDDGCATLAGNTGPFHHFSFCLDARHACATCTIEADPPSPIEVVDAAAFLRSCVDRPRSEDSNGLMSSKGDHSSVRPSTR